MHWAIVSSTSESASVSLSGKIDEEAHTALEKIASELEAFSAVNFSFAQVSHINSLGVRAWVQFIRTFSNPSKRRVRFYECSPEVIMQINMIPSFLGQAQVATFYAHYICDVTHESKKILLHTDHLNKQPPTRPRCQNCTCEMGMESEDLEDEYFAFLMRE